MSTGRSPGKQKPNQNREVGSQRPNRPVPDVQKIEDLLSQLPPDQAQLILTRHQVYSRSGPLPEADEIAKYAQSIPDGANRIMLMAEKAQDEQIAANRANRKLAMTGLWISAILVLFFISAGTYCVYMGMEWAAVVCYGFGVAQVISLFINRRKPHLRGSSPPKNT